MHHQCSSKKLLFTFLYFSIVPFLFSCLTDHSEQYLKNRHYDSDRSILGVNFTDKPEIAIQQIILTSNIREEGYGILLIMDNSIDEALAEKIRKKFKKQDINAVHSYFVNEPAAIEIATLIAINGARFIWVFNTDISSGINPQILKAMNEARSGGGVIVTDKNYFDDWVKLISDI
ncbi:MAG: hypothetical protein K9G76_11480 [Bacteroidales bacterium]|nr:hypothetical protein [Bacteroidales bacterium]MCF8405010.1 hypothetical protein [Bacteroidales bacterium]